MSAFQGTSSHLGQLRNHFEIFVPSESDAKAGVVSADYDLCDLTRFKAGRVISRHLPRPLHKESSQLEPQFSSQIAWWIYRSRHLRSHRSLKNHFWVTLLGLCRNAAILKSRSRLHTSMPPFCCNCNQCCSPSEIRVSVIAH